MWMSLTSDHTAFESKWLFKREYYGRQIVKVNIEFSGTIQLLSDLNTKDDSNEVYYILKSKKQNIWKTMEQQQYKYIVKRLLDLETIIHKQKGVLIDYSGGGYPRGRTEGGGKEAGNEGWTWLVWSPRPHSFLSAPMYLSIFPAKRGSNFKMKQI